MSSRSTFECFGLVIHGFGWPETKMRIEDALSHARQTWIVTANPEILLTAKRQPAYWQALRQADLRLVDGFGLQLMGWFFQASPQRLSGVDLAEHLLALAEERGWSVILLGGADGVADRAAWTVRERHPKLRIQAEHGGSIAQDGSGNEANDAALARLKQSVPDVLLVAFGHPKQEAWIARHLAELQSLKLVVGLGGTLDYWVGAVERAPKPVRIIGLEWLWRLVHEPKRWRRILRAVFIFPYMALLDKCSTKNT